MGNFLTARCTDIARNDSHSGVDQFTRVSVTISDALSIALMFVAGAMYKDNVAAKKRARVLAMSQGDVAQGNGVALLADGSTEQASPGFLRVCLWAGLAPPLRMGDTFYASGVLGSFYTPLRVFLIARLGALAIGVIPGMLAGVPSLVTQLAQGVYYHRVKRDFRSWARARDPSGGQAAEVSCSGAGREFCADVLGYSFCCCLMARADAREVDEFYRVPMDGCFSVVDGPVRVG